MKRRDHSAVIGLCASLVMHGGIVGAFLGIYVKDMDRERWWPALVQRADADGMVWRDGEFGESAGKGEALNSLQGEKLFEGRLAPQEQAPLSRDPVGSGKLADDPEHITALREGVDAPMPALMAGAVGVSAPFGVGDVAERARPAVVARPVMKAIAIEEKGAPEEKVTVPVAVAPVKASAAGKGDAGEVAAASSSGGPAGDPAPMNESESDAFSRAGTIAVRNGKVEARLGRNFKSVKPRLSLKGELDAISVQRPVVEMKVYVDETGKVIDVKVLRSSGSNEIDLPTTSAMYKWWIEPAKDKEGKAIKDVILVTFSYL
jgi:TonB family protein